MSSSYPEGYYRPSDAEVKDVARETLREGLTPETTVEVEECPDCGWKEKVRKPVGPDLDGLEDIIGWVAENHKGLWTDEEFREFVHEVVDEVIDAREPGEQSAASHKTLDSWRDP